MTVEIRQPQNLNDLKISLHGKVILNTLVQLKENAKITLK